MKFFSRRKRPREIRALRWLIRAAAAIGIFAMLTYAFGFFGEMAVRLPAPGAGAWWAAHQFAFMIDAAAAFGLLLAIRECARLLDDETLRRRVVYASLLAAVILLPIVASSSAHLARLGWSANGGVTRERVIALLGDYSAGLILDNVLIAGVYFLKSVLFALFAGLALFGLAVAAFMNFSSGQSGSSRESAT